MRCLDQMTKVKCPKCKTEKSLPPGSFSAELKQFIAEHKGHGCYTISEDKPLTPDHPA